MTEALKLTAYFGERARDGRRLVADDVMDRFGRHELRMSALLRGVEGFGARHAQRTDRLLSLSEDLPVAALAVDVPERVEAAARELAELPGIGLVTLSPATIAVGASDVPHGDGDAKLTIAVGRHARSGRVPAYVAAVAILRAHGVAGATVLLGVDGTVGGERRRARLVGTNAGVPALVVAVAARARLAAALEPLLASSERSLLTLEPVDVLKRDGVTLTGAPPAAPGAAAAGEEAWRRIVVYAGEQSEHRGRPLSPQIVRALRSAGAAGATSLRGVWGYHGDHEPHGDRLWQLRRRAPIVTTTVDAPERVARWLEVVDALTGEAGLVTCEPALRVVQVAPTTASLS